MARSAQVRYQLFLPEPLNERFEALAAGPRVSKSALLPSALEASLEWFAARLGRRSAQLARIERDGHVQLESLALFVRYMLSVNAPLPEGDEAARAVGRVRLAAFVERVGRQLSSGRVTFLAEDGQ